MKTSKVIIWSIAILFAVWSLSHAPGSNAAAPAIVQITLTDQDQADIALYVRADAPDAATLIRKDYLDQLNARAAIKRAYDVVSKIPVLDPPDQAAIKALKAQQEADAAALKKQQDADLAAAVQAALDKKKP